ncbi:ADAMTS-like protein 4 isoform X2 [Xyrauchen texanus]|uniref:ADAMTS-like protein 4 isoform X2 n=1 Tax=Xyrauchen texanus TaxID=154827 RepID=UPI0022424E61|nr:ADAMTS-like protein 4 isoform X2 [Xyrauchen texanus]
MRTVSACRFYAFWCGVFLALPSNRADTAEKPVSGRQSRQAEEEGLEGVWGPWSEWEECSQSCGVGVSERRRQCMPPPQTPPFIWNRPAYLPPGFPNHTPVISAVRPYYNSLYSGNEPPPYGAGVAERPPFYSPPLPANQNPGLPLYRNEAGGSGPVQFGPSNQEPVSVYRSPSFPASSSSSSSLPFSQHGRGSGRLSSHARGRAVGTGSRRSSSIRPGQFGYGRVPFSLPLHRQNRHVRHTHRHNSTTTDSLDAVDVNSNLHEDKTEGDVEKSQTEAAKFNKELKEKRKFKEMEIEAVTMATDTERSDIADEGPSDSETPRQAERTREGERIALSQSLTQRQSQSLEARDSRTSRQVPHSYTHTIHRANTPRDPPPYSLPLPLLQTPTNPNPEPWVLQNGSQPPRNEAERGWTPPATPRNYRCSGKDKEYRRCSLQACPGAALNSRAVQCAAFNSQEFMGRVYDWEPFTEVGLEQQCELTCRPVGYRFYVRQAERVQDGTPCTNNTPNDVCVGGRCLSEGCDGVLGSGLVRDRCGVCGGGDGTCERITGHFLNTSVPLGYHKILDIPPGATAINITERRASPNYLALRSGTGQSVVNGRWAVDPPGEYHAGGTTFLYSRPKAGPHEQGDERGESLTAPGPTTTQLQLYIIFHRQNPGIDYEYYIPVEKKRDGVRAIQREREKERAALREISAHSVAVENPIIPPPVSSSDSSPPFSFPFSSSSSSFSSSSDRWPAERPRPQGTGPNRNARIPPRTDLPLDNQPLFVWRRGPLTECTATCGKGSQYRDIVCVNRHTEQEVHERRCDSATKPTPEEESCNVHPCPPFWDTGVWSECSVSCGWGVQQRQIQCRQSFGNRSTMVHPQRCAGLTRPNATQPCHPRVCSHWEISTNWSTCSVDCGVGKKSRSVRCVSNHGSIVNDRECNDRLRPQQTEDCHMGPCVTNWYFSDWTHTCSAACGPGVQRREVVCLTRGGKSEGGECVGEKPPDMKACNGGPCTSTNLWYTGPWGQCNAACGNGTQRRDIICVKKTGSDFTVRSASDCSHLEKPSPVQPCELQPCRPHWFTTEWSTCSRSCGEGVQRREVRCLTADKKHSSSCDPDSKPALEQSCNTIPCSPFEDENCKDRRHNCVMVVQARLCVYSYYKTACCASCTQNAQRAKRH